MESVGIREAHLGVPETPQTITALHRIEGFRDGP